MCVSYSSLFLPRHCNDVGGVNITCVIATREFDKQRSFTSTNNQQTKGRRTVIQHYIVYLENLHL